MSETVQLNITVPAEWRAEVNRAAAEAGVSARCLWLAAMDAFLTNDPDTVRSRAWIYQIVERTEPDALNRFIPGQSGEALAKWVESFAADLRRDMKPPPRRRRKNRRG